MNRSMLYFTAASALLVGSWLLYFFWLHEPEFGCLVYAGWAVLIVGLVLIAIPMVVLNRKGRPETGEDFTHTTVLVETGIYAVVRHPLYLGWLLMYAAVILFSQHWLTLILGGLGMVCMVLIAQGEDKALVQKFGDPYEQYRASVPGMNVFAWILWALKRTQ